MTSNLERLATCVRLRRRCRTTIHVDVGLGLGWTAAISRYRDRTLSPSRALVAAVAHNLAVMGDAGRLLKVHECEPRRQAKPSLQQPDRPGAAGHAIVSLVDMQALRTGPLREARSSASTVKRR